MQLTGAEIIVECLKEQGVDTVFGYPGGAILNVYDALYEYRDEITHVLTSHEQGASHAADGYARATGKVGVCMATSGPGATNLVTGIATAYMDSVPVVAITANVGKALLGKDSFQEVLYVYLFNAGNETQLYCQGYHQACGHYPQSLLYSKKRPSRSCSGRRDKGRDRREV